MTTSPEPGKAVLRPTIRHLADPVHCLALGFGAGLVPFAPGTFGSVVGLVFALAIAPLGFAWLLVATLAAIVAGLWICGESARRLGVHDHPAIVWDEVVGLLVTLLGTPPSWAGVATGFLLFRALDIFKPWPIYLIDRHVEGGLGIMLDDLLAGILSAFVLHLLRLWPGLT